MTIMETVESLLRQARDLEGRIDPEKDRESSVYFRDVAALREAAGILTTVERQRATGQRLIDANALLARKWDWCDAEDAIRNAPTVDAVSVVRCRDCRKHGTKECPLHEDDDEGVFDWSRPDDYCSLGVKADEETGA